MENLMESKLRVLKQRQEVIFESFASLLGAMAAPVRIRIIHFLAQAPLRVEIIASKVDESIANTSMHLRKMLNEGLVSVERVGQKRLYTLAPEVMDFWERYQDFAQKLDPSLILDSTDLYGDINWALSWEDTLKLIKNKDVLLLDVRPIDEVVDVDENDFVVHIPQQELKSNLKKLSKKKRILVFCRGRLCALSAFTVNYLRESGYKAYRLEVSWNNINQDLYQHKGRL
jgi:DNA-binding transcriptional ArsR family regulator/rhodanese-related sulfurtransferase